MCGRYALTTEATGLEELFEARIEPKLHPRFNIAPSQPVPIIREQIDRRSGSLDRHLTLVRWGLVPQWAKAEDVPTIGNRMINARSETAASKPAFRAAFKYRRCLVPADGFYEWQTVGQSKATPRLPHYITLSSGSPFAFAGLWEHWQDAHGNELETCSILTCEPNDLMGGLHNRMPVILAPSDYAAWLNPDAQSGEALADVGRLLRPFPDGQMQARPVSRHVNSPRHDDPTCIEPLQNGTLFS